MVANTTRARKAPSEEESGNTKNEIKATTGAWWKSTVSEVKDKVEDKSPAEPAGAGTGEATPPEKPQPTRARRAGRKQSTPKGETETGKAEGISPGSDPEQKPVKRPPRKRRTKKTEDDRRMGSEAVRSGTENEAAARVPEADIAMTAGELQESISEAQEGGGAVALQEGKSTPAAEIAPESTVEEVPSRAVSAETGEKKKGGRSRRGKRGNRKQEEQKPAESVHEGARAEAEYEEAEQKEEEGPKAVRKLLINAEEPEECRLALLEEGRLESIYVSTTTRTHTKNNIYKAKIVALEANLQAAFVDYGTEKNGFLPFGEIHPEYYRQDVSEKTRKLIEQHQWKKLSITDVLERGQEVLVQVVKEGVGTKGANMTTYLSLPGRCVVLLPGSDSSGISRKISGEERRSQLREIMETLTIPEGIGWIVRTASNDINKAALTRDVTYLLRLWTEIKKKGQEMEGVGLIYQDHDSVLRFLRENFDSSIEEILVDDLSALEQVKGFVELLPPKQRTVKVRLHKGSRPIFNQYSVEDQIESIYQPRVSLPSGGSIVIDQTEALVAIDVNSGSTSKEHNFEASIFQANMEAASELARQLRLRDLGGLVVIDFIDMRSQKNIREVEKQVKTAMKRDKAKVDISRISKFGLMQISRQKLGAPIDAGTYRVCDHCKGRGTVRSVETLALFYLRRIQTGASRKQVRQVECHFPLDVAQYLLNNKRQELIELEKRYETEISIVAKPSLKPADNEIIYHKMEKESPVKKQA
jgi:ribonuclease E